MREIRIKIPVLLVLLLILGIAQGAFAQADPPGRVARLNFIEGSVSYLPSGGDENDWVTVVMNRPLTAGDRLWVDGNSRGELHIGSTAVRMNSNTGISFLNLDDTSVQIGLSDGAIMLRLRRLDPGDTYEVDTPNLAFAIKRPGDYLIEANPDNNTCIITVRQGEGEVIGGGRSWRVISDQQAIFAGTDALDYDLRDAGAQPLSEFDRWARSRDQREDRAAAPRYVSTEMTGYEDLADYGSWTRVPEYGWSWRPSQVPAGWAPYRFGHWVWIAPWGWTWVEDEPWGFAPFHYGRWANYRSNWIWVPGPMVARPMYAPALVAWVGGGGFGLSIALGGRENIGWFPLGPREVFVPDYRVSERYVTNINVTNTVVNRTNVINVYNNRNAAPVTYMNRAVHNGVTVVPQETFVNARPVARNVMNVPERELASAPVTRGIQIPPERMSVYGAGSRSAPRPQERAMSRPVVTKRTPPPAPNHFEPPQITPPDRPANRTVPQQTPPRQVQPPSRPPQQAQPPPVIKRGPEPMTTRPNQNVEKPQRPSQPTQPSVRLAPPVRPPTPKERADTQTKQKAWENERQRNAKAQNQKDKKVPIKK